MSDKQTTDRTAKGFRLFGNSSEAMSPEFEALCKRERERSARTMDALAKADKESGSELRRTLAPRMEKFLDDFCRPEKREEAEKALSKMLLDVADDVSIFDSDGFLDDELSEE